MKKKKKKFSFDLCLCRVPKLNVTHDEETNEVSVDVTDDPFQYETLDVSNLPVLITVGQVNRQERFRFQ